jgi:hypothetical protein
LDGRPGTRLTAPDRNRSVRAVAIIVLNVEIAFSGALELQFVGPVPSSGQ